MKRKYSIGAAFVVVLVALAVGSSVLRAEERLWRPPAVQAPRFEVDPMWPKPLPNHWVIGAMIGVAVDANDHVWIIHREGSLEAKEKYLTVNPPASRMLRSRSACPRIQCRRAT